MQPEMIQKYEDYFKKFDLHLYAGTFEEDILFLKLWMFLVESEDIKCLIPPENRRLCRFLQIFQRPTITFYSLDIHGRVESLYWFKDPSSGGKTTFCGIWFNSGLRGSKRQIKLTKIIYDLAFEFYDNLLGATWQPEILALLTKLGYNIVGNLPSFMGQEIVYLAHLDRKSYQESKFYKIGNRLHAGSE